MKRKNSVQRQQFILFTLLFAFLLFMMAISLLYGAVSVPFSTVKEAFFTFDAENQLHQVVRSIRLPRVLGAAMVGASLSVSGALAQGITQNPLADSGLLGINAGAGLGLACSFAFFPQAGYSWFLGASFIGAGVSMAIIYYSSNYSRYVAAPLRLTLVGAAISALFLSFSQLLAIQFHLSQALTFWTLGGISIISWTQLKLVAPFFVLALFLAVIYSSSVTILRFGDDAAINLGKSPQRIRLICSLLILVLAGLSVAMVGSVSFVGLIVPHMMRTVVGENYRKLIPFAAVAGALLVVIADFIGRMINPPFEMPFGIIIAMIGVPSFLYLFRKGGNLG